MTEQLVKDGRDGTVEVNERREMKMLSKKFAPSTASSTSARGSAPVAGREGGGGGMLAESRKIVSGDGHEIGLLQLWQEELAGARLRPVEITAADVVRCMARGDGTETVREDPGRGRRWALMWKHNRRGSMVSFSCPQYATARFLSLEFLVGSISSRQSAIIAATDTIQQ